MSFPAGQLALDRARRVTFETSDGPIAALTADSVSDDADRTAALLLSGYTGSKEDFAPVLGPLADAGFAPVAIDLPGQFESPGPADPGAYAPELLALRVLEVAEQLGGQVHLVGHSFGGLVARAAVIAAPERWASLVLLCSGPAGIGGWRRTVIEQLEPVLVTSGLAAVYAASQTLAQSRADYVAPPPALAQFLQTRFLAGAPAMLQGMGQALRLEPDRVDELAATGVRTLVAYGVADDAWPPAVQDEMAARLGAQRIVLPGAAHSPAVENPDATAAALTAFWHPGKGD